jgi:hypothetical protein
MQIEISNGELLDKLSILEIKIEIVRDIEQIRNVGKERTLLLEVAKQLLQDTDVAELYKQLIVVNNKLWEIEDSIRNYESKHDFGPEFIELARAVYFTNDDRSAIKMAINKLTQSVIVEEKSYAKY